MILSRPRSNEPNGAEQMDKGELISKVREFHKLVIDFATGKTMEDIYGTYEKARSEFLQLDQSISPAIPRWIYEKRYGSNFWSFIKSVSPTYSGRRNFIDESFADLYDYIEKGANQPITLSLEQINAAIRNDHVDLLWKKIHSRKSFDKDGAVTACKTLIETVLKYLLDEKGILHSNNDDIKDLYKKVSSVYDLEPISQKSEGFTKVCSGYISIIDGVATIRNKYGDAHGKSASIEIELPENFVDLVINVTGSITTFLLSLSPESMSATSSASI